MKIKKLESESRFGDSGVQVQVQGLDARARARARAKAPQPPPAPASAPVAQRSTLSTQQTQHGRKIKPRFDVLARVAVAVAVAWLDLSPPSSPSPDSGWSAGFRFRIYAPSTPSLPLFSHPKPSSHTHNTQSTKGEKCLFS